MCVCVSVLLAQLSTQESHNQNSSWLRAWRSGLLCSLVVRQQILQTTTEPVAAQHVTVLLQWKHVSNVKWTELDKLAWWKWDFSVLLDVYQSCSWCFFLSWACVNHLFSLHSLFWYFYLATGWWPWQVLCHIDSREPVTVYLLHLIDKVVNLCLIFFLNQQSALWFCWHWGVDCSLFSTTKLLITWEIEDITWKHWLQIGCFYQSLALKSLPLQNCQTSPHTFPSFLSVE